MTGLRIGPIPVGPPVVLAPMAGVTNPAFRQLCREFGGGLYVSEMVTARALVERNAKTLRMVARAPGEPVHSVQLYGVDPAVMDVAVRILVDEVGVDHVDINFGCPAPKVTRKGGGAALPAHPVLLGRLVGAAVAGAGRVPVTVKMRVGLDDATPTALEAARIAEAEGVAGVALHARTAEQRYSGAARWEWIGRLKEALRSIPVLGNGDIWEAADARRMMAITGCDGVVVGRGCLGRPWLFADLADAFGAGGPTAGAGGPTAGAGAPTAGAGVRIAGAAGTATRRPVLGQVTAVMSRHARLLAAHLGEGPGVRDFRKHTGWYLTGYPVGPEVRRRLGQAETVADLDRILGDLDPDLRAPEDAVRWPRGHTDGPRPIALPDRWLETRDDPSPPAGAELMVSGG